MNKLILLLGVIASAVSACTPNILNATFEFTLLTASVPGTELAFCKSLQASSTCCSAFRINQFQQDANAWIAYFEEIATVRDNVLFLKRNDTHEKNDTFIEYLSTVGDAIPLLEDEADPQYDDMIAVLTQFRELITPLVENYDGVQDNFTLYQQTRSTCMITALQSQAAAWCLTCDPNNLNNGLSDTDLDYDATFKTRVLADCYPFLDVAASQGGILYLDVMYEYVQPLIDSAQLVIDGELAQALEDFGAVHELIQNVVWGDNVTELPVFFPDDCTEDSCDWFFTDVFVKGSFSESELIFGGVIPKNPDDPDDGTPDPDDDRRLRETGKSLTKGGKPGRKLAGTWSPAADEAGIYAHFKVNPGWIDNENENSALRNSVIAFFTVFVIFLLE